MKPLTPEIEYCRATVKSWERLRLLYNAIMLVAGGLVLLRTLYLQDQPELDAEAAMLGTIYPIAHPLELIAVSVLFGCVANVCYCLGPYLEFVITAAGFPISGQRSRYLIFGLGTMLSVAVIGCAWLAVEYYLVSPLIPTP